MKERGSGLRRRRRNRQREGYYALKTVLFLACLLAGSVFIAYLAARDFGITGIARDGDQVRIGFESDTNSYYVLYRGTVVTGIVSSADLRMGTDGVGQLSDPPGEPAANRRYYRVLKVPIVEPRDTDGDGIDDVYELARVFLDPLDQTDGRLDQDQDGAPNRIEYHLGTDPDNDADVPDLTGLTGSADSDGDGYQDLYEWIHGSDTNDNTSTPVADIFVAPGPGTNGQGTVSHPFTTIQAALDAAVGFDIIELADGTYAGAGNRDLDYKGKPVMVVSANGAKNCVIDCRNVGRGFAFETHEDARSVLDGVTIRNGYGSTGGGIYAFQSGPTIQNCTLAANFGGKGGGICNWGHSAATIQNCLLIDNEAAQNGGGIYNSYSSATIRDCIVVGNSASLGGGGISNAGENPTIRNCVIAENNGGSFGGGIYNGASASTIQNCTIVENDATTGGGIYTSGEGPVLHNCIVWSNSSQQISGTAKSVSYSAVQNGDTNDGNINTDPRLTATYRLQADSPCIDAGSTSNAPAADMDGEPRWDDPDHNNVTSIVDMGADEFVDTDNDELGDAWELYYAGNLAPLPADDNDAVGGTDGLVNSEEYHRFTDPGHADTDRDGLPDGDEVNLHGTDPLDDDSDGDFNPDGWEQKYGLNPLDAADMLYDPDRDRIGNHYEFVHGSNPTNPASVPAPSLHVDASAPAGGAGSAASPLNTIQAALDEASDLDIIQLADGTYKGAGNKDLDYAGKRVMVLSAGGAGQCIIDCQGHGRGISFETGEDVRSVLRGLTIRNGKASAGGGISVTYSRPTILNCIIRDCNGSNGGGVYCYTRGTPTIKDCLIVGNSASSGGGFYASGVSATLQNCTIVKNSASYGGGISSSSEVTIQNCTVVSNSASYGGGIRDNGSPVIRNCIVWGNVPDQLSGSRIKPTYSAVENGGTSDGNINTDPQLTKTYRLHAGSPCIDAGSASNAPPADLDGELRWDDPDHDNAVSAVDMGADEFVDHDNDELADHWELFYAGDLTPNATDDNDAVGGPDGLDGRQEYDHFTDPGRADTDEDGLNDGDEINTHATDPLDADTDDDFIRDGWEHVHGQNPLDASDMMADPDGDEFGNVYEHIHGTIPTNAASVPRATLHVSASASAGGDGSVASPFDTIQAAIDAAVDYDIIQLADGVYAEAGNRDVSYKGKPVMVVSGNGTDRCVIDCQGNGRGFIFEGREDQRSVLRGVTIRDGDADRGGAIRCDSSSPTILRCVLVGNKAHAGGALYSESSAPTVLNCTLKGNEASQGGGVANQASNLKMKNCLLISNYATVSGGGVWNCYNSDSAIDSCRIVGNSAATDGGGIWNDGSSPVLRDCTLAGNRAVRDGGGYYGSLSSPSFRNCTVSRNRATKGGGLYNIYGTPQIERCLIEGNRASDGGGIHNRGCNATIQNCTVVENSAIKGGGIHNDTSSPTVQNCTVVDNDASDSGGGIYSEGGQPVIRNSVAWGNTPEQVIGGPPLVSYSCVDGGSTSNGNVRADPQLTETYRLRAGSPCIDAGSASDAPAADMDGEARWDDPGHSNVTSSVDMGADEFVDTDRDGLGDTWELHYAGNLTPMPADDNDAVGGADGLNNNQEYNRFTAPGLADTDEDGLRDGDEINLHGTDPLAADSDGDFNPDGWEQTYGQNPLDPSDMMSDPDDDGIGNYYEAFHSTVPTNAASFPNATLFVDASAPGGDGSAAAPFRAIQDALDVARDADVVLVADGTYTGARNTELRYWSKALMLVSANGTVNCTVECDSGGRGVDFAGMEDARSILRGITIRGGYATQGGGILNRHFAAPTIRDCTLLDNSANEGGGIYNHPYSTPLLLDCTLARNDAARGGGMLNAASTPELRGCTLEGNIASSTGGAIHNAGASPVIHDCILTGNWTEQDGGGIYSYGSSYPTIRSCTISGNLGRRGGGVFNAYLSRPTLQNCVFSANTASTEGGAMYNEQSSPAILNCTLVANRATVAGGAIHSRVSTALVRNSILWGNAPDQIGGSSNNVEYSVVENGGANDGNINTDPQLTMKFRLRADSPCIDAGSGSNAPLTDMDGESRWDDPNHANVASFVDMGADEFVDTDSDELADHWELFYAGDLTPGPGDDNDAVGGPDGLDNRQEYEQFSDPGRADSDSDGLTDGDEVVVHGTDPLRADSDGDFITDAWELEHGLKPLDASDMMRDADGDRTGNFYEFTYGTIPTNAASVPVATLHVDPYAPAGGEGTVAEPFNTIQAALDVALDTDIIQLAEGIYVGTGNRDLDYWGKRVLVRSESGAQDCVIDCQRLGRGAHFRRHESGCAALCGVTIRNARTHLGGGAICCERVSNPTIQDCILIDNEAREGGGIFNDGASPTIRNCILTGNSVHDFPEAKGGGIHNRSSSPEIEGCTLTGNFALFAGGGICNDGSESLPTILDCYLADNSSESGGAIHNDRSSPGIQNCVMVGNRATKGAGICNGRASSTILNCTLIDNRASFAGGGIYSYSSSPVLRNCILWENQPQEIYGGTPVVSHSCVEGGGTDNGNIRSDPRLTPSFWLRAGSPCIDAGSASNAPPEDMDGELRWDDPTRPNAFSIVDIGADEFVDTDADGMGDAWERLQFGDLSHDGTGDDDAEGGPDGLNDLGEFESGADPHRGDTDGDGLSDGEEVSTHGSSPLNTDTDGDEARDGDEVAFGRDPAVHGGDADDDGCNDDLEVVHGTDPGSPVSYPTDLAPFRNDDGDDLPDWWEIHWFDDLTQDDKWDDDDDRVSEREEFEQRTDPTSDADGDGDGLADDWERFHYGDTNITDGAGDLDGDGLSDAEEYRLGTDPADMDTFDDGYLDGSVPMPTGGNAFYIGWLAASASETPMKYWPGGGAIHRGRVPVQKHPGVAVQISGVPTGLVSWLAGHNLYINESNDLTHNDGNSRWPPIDVSNLIPDGLSRVSFVLRLNHLPFDGGVEDEVFLVRKTRLDLIRKGLPEPEEEYPGVIVPRDEGGAPVSQELVPLFVAFPKVHKTGTITLSRDNANIHVWAGALPVPSPVLTSNSSKSWNLEDEDERDDFHWMQHILWVQGVKAGESLLTVSHSASPDAEDSIKFTFDGEPEFVAIDWMETENETSHHTAPYQTSALVLRRAQEFKIKTTLTRAYRETLDDVWFQAEHVFDGNWTTIDVPCVESDLEATKWYCKLLGVVENADETKTVEFEISTPSTNTPIGQYSWQALVGPKDDAEVVFDTMDFPGDVIILFNPWDSDDAVHMPNGSWRTEYVMRTSGRIWGFWNKNRDRPWRYEQFSTVSLEVLLWALGGLNSEQRSSPVAVSRHLTERVDGTTDVGILYGRWDGAYSDGTHPGFWSGSDKILAIYKSTGSAVKYGQCWVFGGLLTTMLRCAGIPARPVTNYRSAHDTDGNKALDFYYLADRSKDTANTEDSVWNFHVWCDAWMKRPDRPGHDGWQAVDGTPQELSDTLYRCGPASHVAVKNDLGGDYDVDFVFAEVDADVHKWLPRSGGGHSIAHTDTTDVGRDISTKAVGADTREDITSSYK